MGPRGYKLGVDIGGTFTDIALVDDESGEAVIYKTVSSPQNFHIGVIRGICELLEKVQRRSIDCRLLVHGTTIGINTLLEGSGEPTGLLVTKGFRDLLEIGRMRMPDPYNLNTQRIEPIVRRNLVEEVNERIGSSGEILVPVDCENILSGVSHLVQKGIVHIAICFLNSYKNSAHEVKAKDIIRDRFPQVSVLISSEVWPQVREYERGVLTVISTFITSKVQSYLQSLEKEIYTLGIKLPIYITVSNGGILPANLVKDHAILTLSSGPSAGVVGAAYMANLWGVSNLLTFDMGGTSTDIAIVRDGQIPITNDSSLAGYPITFPCVDIHSIGAGGGSIVRLDNAGVVKVGPASAGADPGPACYGKGGQNATVTDAYVVAGIIDPRNFLGGRLRVSPELSYAALSRLGEHIGFNAFQMAEGIIRIVASNCVAEISRIAAKTGIDPRDFSLLAYGGAGPAHACFVAEEIGIRQVLIPLSPGTFSAWGSLVADLHMDFVKSIYAPLGSVGLDDIRKWYASILKEAEKTLAFWEPVEDFQWRMSFDMRCEGQGFDIEVPLIMNDLEQSATVNRIATIFHKRYREMYGVYDPSVPVDLINLRMAAIGRTRKVIPRRWATCQGAVTTSVNRLVMIGGKQVAIPVYLRTQLGPGNRIEGPCVVDQDDSTTFLHPGWYLQVGEEGTLFLRKEA